MNNKSSVSDIQAGKICSGNKCKNAFIIQPYASFHKKKSSSDGFDSRCKSCVSKSKKNRYKLLKRNKKSRQRSNITKVLDVNSCLISEHKVIIEDSCADVFREFIREVLVHE